MRPYGTLWVLVGPYASLLACLHMQFWEPVLSSSAGILLSHTQKRFAESHTKPFLCVTQQKSGTRT